MSSFKKEYCLISSRKITVCINRQVLKYIWHHAKSEPTNEVGGILFGQCLRLDELSKFKVFVDAFEKVHDPNAESDGFTFTGKEKIRVCDLQREKYEKLRQVGWYHSHRNPHGIFLSSQDEVFCGTNYHQPWHIALLIHADRNTAGIFAWRQDQKKMELIKVFNLKKVFKPW